VKSHIRFSNSGLSYKIKADKNILIYLNMTYRVIQNIYVFKNSGKMNNETYLSETHISCVVPT
jgi:hypothetical protein